jgi:hypothetical protein
MKRKVKKFNEGGKTYDKETEGLFGGKINYREEDGRKYVAGKANLYDRNPQEQRYYSADDVKGKLSGLFGGKKETPKSVDSEPVGDANKSSSYNTRAKPEEPRRQITDYIKKSEPEEPYKPTGKTFLREEADIEEKPAKKVVAKKVDKKVEPKASMDVGIPKDNKSTRMPSGYDKLDLREKETPKKTRTTADIRAGRDASEEESKVSVPKNTFLTKERQEKADKSFYAGFKSKPVRTTADIRAGRQVEGKKKGGIVKSASARADGCAIRGKTRA